MKRSALLITVCIVLSVLILSGCDLRVLLGRSGELEVTPTTEVVVGDDTRILDEAALATLANVSPDGSVLTFAAGDPAVDAVETGDVLVIGPSENSPYGLLRKVEQVTSSEGEVIVTTSQASVEDAVQEGDIEITWDLLPEAATAVIPAHPGITFRNPLPGAVPAATLGHTFVVDLHCVPLDLDDDPDNGEQQITIDGTLEFTLGFRLDISVRWFKLQKVEFAVFAGESVFLEATGDFEGSVERRIELGSIRFSTIKFMAGPLPVWITPKIILWAGLDGSVSAELSTSLTQGASVEPYIRWTASDGWDSGIEFINEGCDFQPPVAAVSCSAKVYAGPEFQMLLYGLAGPLLGAEAYLDFGVCASSEEGLGSELYWGLDVNIGAALSAIGDLEDIRVPVLEHRELIWEYTEPDPEAPAAPTGLSVEELEESLRLTWDEVPLADSYNLYWSNTPGAGTGGTRIPGASSPYTHESLTTGVPYYYVVTAQNAVGEGLASAQVSGTALPSSAKEITAFSFVAASNGALASDAIGSISGTDIAVGVPLGTDVTALVASFATTGLSVAVGGTEQTSGSTANDFTNPVTYTVTAEDSSTQDYIVGVAISAATESAGFGSAEAPGDTGVLILSPSSETLTMIYAQDQASISFPTGTDDSASATLTTRFWIAETEVTNAVLASVFQWAYDNGRFSSTVGDHNGLDATTVKHGGKQLLDLDDVNCRVDYDGSGSFTVESGFENNPGSNVTWYGAVMFSNWLTEMRDGNVDNVAYTAIDTSWEHDETVEDIATTGYRLPTSNEWEFAARYLGTTAPSTGGRLDTEVKYGNDDATWTDGYYWTPGNYAAGAYTYHNDESDTNPANGVVDNKDANDQVAVYGDYYDGGWISTGTADEAPVGSLGGGSANELGLYDMSGNIWEWVFTGSGPGRYLRGGYYGNDASYLQVGYSFWGTPADGHEQLGFRLCRTAD